MGEHKITMEKENEKIKKELEQLKKHMNDNDN
jgi:hypothetical protein